LLADFGAGFGWILGMFLADLGADFEPILGLILSRFWYQFCGQF
jgi:hypothetical protein